MRPDEVQEEIDQLWTVIRVAEQNVSLHGQECNNDRIQTRQRIERVEQALGNALTPGITARLQALELQGVAIQEDLKEIKESAQWTRRHLLTVAGALVTAIVIGMVNYVLTAAKVISGGTTTH